MPQRGKVLDLAHRIIAHAPVEHTIHYTIVVIKESVAMAPKSDGLHAPKEVLLFGLGEYAGGEVWIEDLDGEIAPQWYRIPPSVAPSTISITSSSQKLHGVFPAVGRRFSIALFKRDEGLLDAAHVEVLAEHGFLVGAVRVALAVT